ncbi:NAD(P)H-dependent glycerol-3-phosphate dehydrogenase [Limimaricola variabilis]|uniref:NAD(P)H-dependent glycerol-3-phosphate dehydrogenase n=1 Tax=Limimaricola variabilis TaxID=1492771 RepID=UPI002AC8D91D|nr:NAD(P)H-dependent glycerol-3-phosphate dehydrogenase [Limimaricola variabilis]WPY93661.1 NAD(P)H-dependent glycerol-3-phosphate dehydrogenase [Limimaricola variabilis]
MRIGIAGAGAFGAALAVALARTGREVTLWARDAAAVEKARENRRVERLPEIDLPASIDIVSDLDALLPCDTILLALPAQATRGFVTAHAEALAGKVLVACAKGIDLTRLTGQTAIIAEAVPSATPALLTGPSFAADIARGLPTALTLACADEGCGAALQAALSTPGLRLYRTADVIGAELGGALKNVIAIACGACIGAGFGDSARAALMTRGFAEMQRLAASLGARPETLMGLSGFGDLVLTCSSELSRNYRYGLALGRGESFDTGTTVEGAATARAVTDLAAARGLDLPISAVTARMVAHDLTPHQALDALINRPLKEESE